MLQQLTPVISKQVRLLAQVEWATGFTHLI